MTKTEKRHVRVHKGMGFSAADTYQALRNAALIKPTTSEDQVKQAWNEG